MTDLPSNSCEEEPDSPEASERPTRRKFLVIVAAGAAVPAIAVSGCSGGGTGAEPEPFGDVSAGNVNTLAVGALQIVQGAPAVLGRDDAGVYAMTITCTHAGCPVSASGTGVDAQLFCPCHGSQFDRNGNVQRGPAASPLAHFAVSIDASGNITVHGGTRVDAGVRVAA